MESVTKERDVTRRGGGETDRTDGRREEKVFSSYVTQGLKGESSGLWFISNSSRQNNSLVERKGGNLVVWYSSAGT